MVEAVRTAEAALGGVQYGPSEHEGESLVFRRSLFVVQDISAGESFTSENIRSIRPGYGLAPRYYDRESARRHRVTSPAVPRWRGSISSGMPMQNNLAGISLKRLAALLLPPP